MDLGQPGELVSINFKNMWIDKPSKITDSFYFIGTFNNPVYLLRKLNDWVLIEGGIDCIGNLVYDQIISIVGKPEMIKTWIITHSHYDHVGMIPRLSNLFPNASIYASAETIQTLKENRTIEIINKYNQETSKLNKDQTHILNFDKIEIKDLNQNINLHSLNLKFIPAKGHSDCQVSVYEESEGVLFVSDALGELIEPFSFFPLPFFSPSIYQETIKKLKEVNPEYIALGHNGVLYKNSAKTFDAALNGFYIVSEKIEKSLSSGMADSEVAKELTKEFSHHSKKYVPVELHLLSMKKIVKLLKKEVLPWKA